MARRIGMALHVCVHLIAALRRVSAYFCRDGVFFVVLRWFVRVCRIKLVNLPNGARLEARFNGIAWPEPVRVRVPGTKCPPSSNPV